MRWKWLAAGAVAAVIAVTPFLGRTKPAPTGEMAPLEFTLPDMSGASVNLADFKGRPILINFWATWCGPCRAEMPMFVELIDQYKDKGFTIIGISVDDTAAELKPFVAQNKLNYPILMALGREEVLERFNASTFPTSWLVRRDGTVQVKQVGVNTEAWFRSQVKELVDGQ